MANDPCTDSLTTSVIEASGAKSVTYAKPSTTSKFDCFYVYPTVSGESSLNADLKVQSAETNVAIAQASRFSTVCRVFAPMYRQITLAGLETSPTASSASDITAYDSIRAGFEYYLAHYNDGRPIIFIGHSQGAAMSILLLEHFVDNNAAPPARAGDHRGRQCRRADRLVDRRKL
jgi:predicted peptidase